MRKIPLTTAALAVLGLTVVALTGCSSSTTSACERPVDDSGLADVVTVSGEFGSEATVDVYRPLTPTTTASDDVIVGEGNAITTDTQLVVVDLTVVSGEDDDAEPFYGSTRAVQLSELTGIFPGLSEGLRCATEGSRVVVALPADSIDAGTAQSVGLSEGDSAIAVVDLRQVYLARAQGADVFNSGLGLPSVVRATDGRPGVIVPDSAPPTDVVVETLIRGDGDVVTGDAPVRVNYTSVGWESKTQTQTTWDASAPSITFGADAPPFAESLIGHTVGSQVLVIVPGEAETQIYVVDILGIDAVEQ
ncbi:FKBP-type peptidyl-prolyl cis-trans isomerase [Microbacterium aoyamense]|uniref:FKBP-type peptidyl-prolyl cis-trans isomerase n=1 Tax=Microbacterium aoyamense TaxID=344166 RepID=A0ABN2PU77_9MICO|nr:hypothetical protein [Microbacterium aoyamense]